MRILITVLLLAPLASVTTVALPAPAAFAGEKDKAPVTDDTIVDQVRLRLAGDADVKGGGIDVVVKDGAVTLNGLVDTEKARQKAERLTKKVKGVRSVINNLKLRT
ncbi:MAG TPA: BON domain-containing protein [Bryobacteraceae bacterium]|nr:BON domain-containing protein [Bryobacteraceae bacterium]